MTVKNGACYYNEHGNNHSSAERVIRPRYHTEREKAWEIVSPSPGNEGHRGDASGLAPTADRCGRVRTTARSEERRSDVGGDEVVFWAIVNTRVTLFHLMRRW